MSTLKKQMDLIKRIPLIDNESILDAIYDLINTNETDIVQFTKEEEEQVLRALDQVKNGQVVSNEEGNREIQKWL
ncbi:MAG TPA: hypothetical protein DCY51_11520 [Bacteroidetes bacterium]|nr:hypothetical protein [Bacteroidota bacterium]